MNSSFTFKKIPRSRIATFDIFSVGLQKHHVSALVEFDVTNARKKIHALKENGKNVSFNAWLIKVIGAAVQLHPQTAAFFYNKKKLILFSDVRISILVEKQVNGTSVPIPMIIEGVGQKSVSSITYEIEKAKKMGVTGTDVVINKKTTVSENVYYFLPALLRRMIWKILLRNPKAAYNKMGNVIISSVGMIGKINGWFIHKSIHPLAFGIGSILEKPVVIDNEIKIREVLNMTILADHDVVDGGPMVRFLNDLTNLIESGSLMEEEISDAKNEPSKN